MPSNFLHAIVVHGGHIPLTSDSLLVVLSFNLRMLTPIGWFPINISAEIHGYQMLNHNDTGNALAFHVGLQTVKISHLLIVISKHPQHELA